MHPPAPSRDPSLLWTAALLAALIGGPAQALAPVQDAHPAEPELQAWRGHTVVAGEVLVRMRAGLAPAARAALRQRQGLAPLGAVRADVERLGLAPGASLSEALERLGADPDVAAVQPNVAHAPSAPPADDPDDPDLPLQWGLQTVGAPAAWPGLAHAGARLAVIDSGADLDHPDLVAVIAGGHDTYSGDPLPEDVTGHGTHCTGIAAAATDNGEGMAGAAWGAEVLVYRTGNAVYPTSALVPAIDLAVADGARVLSLSWGSTWNDPLVAAALQDAHDAGALIVASAGNDGNTTPFYPAALPFVLGVASSRQNDQRSSFSNHGGWVDVTAPGQGIWSTWKGGAYTFSSGTSMACPLVAGMGALLYANLGADRTPARAAAVRAALQDSAVDVGSWVAHGRVDFAAACAALFAAAPPAPTGATPAQLQALRGQTLTLTGSGLVGVSAVTVGGQPAEHRVVSDGVLEVLAGNAADLGPAGVVASNAAGDSAPLPVEFVPTAPPRLVAPAQVPDGGAMAWEFGGLPGHVGVLIVALDDDTFPYYGDPILVDLIILAAGALDAQGLGGLSGALPPGLSGLTFHSQVATLDAGAFVGASPPLSTTITD